MRELLDSATKRRLNILEQLNRAANWISSTELAQLNQASLRTINNDLNYLKQHWAAYFKIETSKKNGVRLVTPQSSHVQIVYNAVFQRSDSFSLLENIFFDPNRNLEDWEESMFISESSLYRIANQLADSLERYDLTIQKRPCQLTNHKELYVRYFYTTFFYELYGLHDWPFILEKEKIIIISQAIYEMIGFSYDDVQLMYLSYILAVTCIRYSQGLSLPSEEKMFLSDHLTTYQLHCLTDIQLLLSDLVSPLHISDLDGLLEEVVNSIYFLRKTWLEKVDTLSVQKLLQKFMNRIAYLFDIDIEVTNKEQIIHIILHQYLYYLNYPFANFILFDQYQFTAQAIEEKYPTFTHIIFKELEKLEKSTHFLWFSEFRHFIIYILLIKWQNLPTILENKKAKAHILTISNLGSEHAKLLADMINYNFEHKTKVEPYQKSVIFLDQLNLLQLEPYDYFVTTCLQSNLPEDKVIVVDAIPSNQDWKKIRCAVNKIHHLPPDTNLLNQKLAEVGDSYYADTDE